MVFQLVLDPEGEEKVTARVHARTPLVDELERLVLSDGLPERLPGYVEDEIRLLHVAEIECFAVENEKIYALYRDGQRYLVRKRLYELESILPGYFERMNKSAIGNWKKVVKLRVQFSGAVDAVFRSGYTEMISRRCFAELKRRYRL